MVPDHAADVRALVVAESPDIIIVDALAEGIPVEQRAASCGGPGDGRGPDQEKPSA